MNMICCGVLQLKHWIALLQIITKQFKLYQIFTSYNLKLSELNNRILLLIYDKIGAGAILF